MRAILSNAKLCATPDVNHPLVQCIHTGLIPPVSHLVAIYITQSTLVNNS